MTDMAIPLIFQYTDIEAKISADPISISNITLARGHHLKTEHNASNSQQRD